MSPEEESSADWTGWEIFIFRFMGAELGWVCHRVVLHGSSEPNIL